MSDAACQLAKSALAAKYEAAQKGGGSGGATLEVALRELGEGDGACLEVEDFDINGKPRVMVLDVKSRARLAMCASHAFSFRPGVCHRAGS